MVDIGRERMTPEILHMLTLAANPETSAAGGFTEDGEFKFNAFKKPKEAKPEGEAAQPAAEAKPTTTQPTQPTTPFAGFGPAMAALAGGGGGGLTAGTLRGLTPEQITGLLNVESAKQRLQQGTIGQLLELPYRQALTAKALRPEVPKTPPVPLDVRTRLAEARIAGLEREPTKPLSLADRMKLKAAPGAEPAYPQGDWFRSPTGEIDWYDKGKDVPAGWERMPSREQVTGLTAGQAATLEWRVSQAADKVRRELDFEGNPPLIEYINRNSIGNVGFVWKDHWWYDNTREIKLPRLEGRQLTMVDVRREAEERKVSIEDVLTEIHEAMEGK